MKMQTNKRIASLFARLQAENRAALIPYITAGDPMPGCSSDFMHALVAGGADLLELGMPFSDPEADGPDVQAACERALAQGTSLQDTLAEVAAFRRTNTTTPVILMGYLNPIERMGYARFATAATAADVDGVLIVNMPPEEAGMLGVELRTRGLDVIYLVAPTTTAERARKISKQCSGFLYSVSLKGITGSDHLDITAVRDRVATLRQLTDLPLAVGFGINDKTTAGAVAEVADGVVVGSAVVRRIANRVESPDRIASELRDFMLELRTAIDNSRSGRRDC